MRIRKAVASDIPQIARIGVRAFENEPIYERLFPRRHIYKEDYLQSFADDAYKFIITPGHLIVVAEIDDGTDGQIFGKPAKTERPSRIVGYASFIGHGPPEKWSSWNTDSLSNRLERLLFNLRRHWSSLVSPNRAVWWPAVQEYCREATAVQQLSLADPNGSRVVFETLAVDPAYQGQGIGERLVQWCGVMAWKAGVPVFGDATATALPLYLKCGCKDIGHVRLPKQVVAADAYGDSVECDALEVVVLKWEAKSNPLVGNKSKRLQ